MQHYTMVPHWGSPVNETTHVYPSNRTVCTINSANMYHMHPENTVFVVVIYILQTIMTFSPVHTGSATIFALRNDCVRPGEYNDPFRVMRENVHQYFRPLFFFVF